MAMTRQEFIDEICDADELADFLYGNDLTDFMENVQSGDAWDDYINEDLVDWAREYSWQDLLSKLREIEDNSGYDYYWYDDYEGWVPMDGDRFDEWKDQVIAYMDRQGLWEDDEDEPETVEHEQEPFEESEEEEDIDFEPDDGSTFMDVIAVSVGCLQEFRTKQTENNGEETPAVEELFF